MDIISSSLKWQFQLVYLDDVVIFSKSSIKHISRVQHGLTLLNDSGWHLSWRNACSSRITWMTLATSSSLDAWKLPHIQSTRSADYKPCLTSPKFSLSIICALHVGGLYQTLPKLQNPSIANCKKTNNSCTKNYATWNSTFCKPYRRTLLHNECSCFYNRWVLIPLTLTLTTKTLDSYCSENNLMDTTSPLATCHHR